MKTRPLRTLFWALYFCSLVLTALPGSSTGNGEVVVITINGPINPATDDFLKTSIAEADAANARLLVIRLNTPGGLLTSMQTMVEQILDSPVPTAVYVSPSGGGAISAGVFITLAGNFAVMAPGTTIGAAHPVTGGGQDIGGDMRQKVENFAVSLIKAISETRGRNVEWAEKAVRESVAITDRDALDNKVIDFIASDLDRVLEEIEGKTTTVQGKPVTLTGVVNAPRRNVEMSFKQTVVNILADPNVAILLGLGAMLGIGIELYHPGGLVPGIVGAICLILSLTSAQVIPINYGGVALIGLSILFFIVEFFIPSFGLWGIAGIVCLVLGSIYFVDSGEVWSVSGFTVDPWLVGSIAAGVGLILLITMFLVIKAASRKVTTGREGMVGKTAVVQQDFKKSSSGLEYEGTVRIMGEIWRAVQRGEPTPRSGQKVVVSGIEDGLTLLVEPGGQD